MIRLNLLYRWVRPVIRWQGPTIAVLALGLFLQGVFALRIWYEGSQVEKEAEQLRGRLVELEQRLEQTPKVGVDLSKLAGQLLDRNRWVESRCRSPVETIAKLDQGRQPGLHLISFEGKSTGGSLRLLASDMVSAAR